METAGEKKHYRCEKHQEDLDSCCPKCKDPELYCKFRTACVIHFLEKESRNTEDEAS